MSVGEISVGELIERYDTILLDAYGVLVEHGGAISGASHFIDRLNSIGKSYFVVTNDASKLPARAAEIYASYGLDISSDRIISSGSLLHDYFALNSLVGARCAVIGTDDSRSYVEQAGGRVVDPLVDSEIDAVVLCDEEQSNLFGQLDTLLDIILKRIERGSPLSLILPNPDLIYTRQGKSFALAAGSIAAMLETAIKARFPDEGRGVFERLGKPYPWIFQKARKASGTDNMVMVGDQLLTDIKGANEFGIDSVLVGWGVASLEALSEERGLIPKYVLKGFC